MLTFNFWLLQRDELERQLEAARQAERQLRRRAQYLEEDHVLTAAAISSAVVADGAGTLNRPPPQGPLTVAVQKLVQVGEVRDFCYSGHKLFVC